MSSESTTEAGRYLLDHDIRDLVRMVRAATGVPDSMTVPRATYEYHRDAITAIEAEAVAAYRTDIRKALLLALPGTDGQGRLMVDIVDAALGVSGDTK